MPGSVAVYVRAEDRAVLSERGYDWKAWIRSAAQDALDHELRNGSPEPNQESRIRREVMKDMYAQLRLLALDGVVLDVATIDKLAEAINLTL